MKLTRKLLCLLLALALILPMFPAVARAEEVVPQAGVIAEELPVQINPLYEGIISLEDLNLPEAPKFEPGAAQPHATYTTTEKGGEAVRQNMKDRTESFTVYVKTKSNSLQAICDEMTEIAMKHTGKATEGDYLMWQYAAWKASSYKVWNSATQEYSYDITFTFSYYTTADQETEMNTAVTNLINSLGVKNKSDYEKIKGVYDWLCDNVTYDYANLEDTSYMLKHTAYAALIDKTAVCQGYAVLFYRLMLELGVDNRVIVGDGGGPHAWNIVELDNLYYNLDSTWDAGMEEYSFFLLNSENFLGHYRFLEYETIAFHSTYPIAKDNYTPGVKGTKSDYIYTGNCGADITNATWKLGYDSVLYIEGEGATYDFNSYDEDPYYSYWIDEITKVSVAEGITRIGEMSFYDFTALKEVSLPATVTTIGEDAFRSCDSLETVKSDGGLTTIEKRAFFECKALKTFVFPSTLKTIGESAFDTCYALNVSLPNGLETIGDDAFFYCSGMTSLTIPSSITSFGSNIFYGSGNLTSVTVSEGITAIPSGMFNQCGKLKTVKLPNSLKTIGNNAFNGCWELSSITLPNGLEGIGYRAFAGCPLTKLQIPETVTGIGGEAFYDCTKLTTVNLPKGLTEISNGCFRSCPLTSITIPSGVTRIGDDAFYASKITEIVIPEGVTEIGDEAFGYCTNLSKVTLPSTLKSLSGFGGCEKLTSISIPDGVTSLGDYAFEGCTGLTSIDLPDGITTMGYNTFRGITGLTELELPDSLTNIPNCCMEGCTGLTSIVVPKNVAKVGYDAFGDCTNLTKITFLGNAPDFAWNSFSGITATVYYPQNQTWTEDVRQSYDGYITWVPYAPPCTDHTYDTVITAPTCTEQGYTTYTCTNCGHSYVDDYTAPVDHVYEDDYCKWCGQGAQNIRWYSGTTSLNGTIDLNIYVLLSKDLAEADDTYVRFIYGSNIVDVPMSKALPSPTDTAPNRYRFSCPIYAKQLADNVTVKFMKGSQQIGKDLNYSVVKYCVNQIAKVTDPQEVALYKAMLNYGAAAQLMFDHNIENLANASLSEADKLLPDVDASAYKYAISGKEDGIRAKSATLMLEDVVKVRVYFALTGDKSIEDYIFTIDGKEVAVQQNDKGYYVETSGIAAKDLEKMFSVQVGGITVSYGALSYVNSMANGSKELEANISKALFVYWQAAESYLG